MKKDKPAKWPAELIGQISLGDLILLALYSCEEAGEKKCFFERLLAECFSLFPRRLVLTGYPKWPDSRKIDRPLRALRKKNLIAGAPKNSYMLTQAGRTAALKVYELIRQKRLELKS